MIRAAIRRVHAGLARGAHALRAASPGFWSTLRGELLAGRPWIDRTVVLGFAALTGLVAVGFTLLAEGASHAFASLRQASTAGP